MTWLFVDFKNNDNMNTKDNFAILNVAGSSCSIIALLLTLSGNLSLKNIVQVVFGVVSLIGMVGLILGIARFFWGKYIGFDIWYVKLLYWLFVFLMGAFLSGAVGIGVYFIVEFLLVMGKSALQLL